MAGVNKIPAYFNMSDMKKLGIPFTIDQYERNLIFNLNILEMCVEKFGKMDDIFKNVNELEFAKWIAVEMYNEDAEIQNEENPDLKIPKIDEKYLKRRIDGMGGFRELQEKINEAILKGLPKESVKQLEDTAKNLLTTQN